jgi:hypothetical protein
MSAQSNASPERLRRLFREFLGMNDSAATEPYFGAKVVSVNEAEQTVAVTPEGQPEITIDPVLLNLALDFEDGGGLYALPKLGSTVLVKQNVDDSYQVAFLSAISKLCWKIGSQTLTIDGETTAFNGGDNGGMVLIGPLVSAINALKADLRVLGQSLASHVHTGVTTGPGSSGPSPSLTSPPAFADTKRSDLEDTKLTH